MRTRICRCIARAFLGMRDARTNLKVHRACLLDMRDARVKLIVHRACLFRHARCAREIDGASRVPFLAYTMRARVYRCIARAFLGMRDARGKLVLHRAWLFRHARRAHVVDAVSHALNVF